MLYEIVITFDGNEEDIKPLFENLTTACIQTGIGGWSIDASKIDERRKYMA